MSADRHDRPSSVRLDVWLDVACLFRTRSEAQRACRGGKVEVGGTRAKPHRLVRIGDEITITRPYGRRQIVRVVGLAERHIEKARARELYEDLTPPPTPEEIAWRQLARQAGVRSGGAPDRRERRALRRLRGKA